MAGTNVRGRNPHVRGDVRGNVRGQRIDFVQMCGVCGHRVHGRARTRTHTRPHPPCATHARVYTYPAHPAHLLKNKHLTPHITPHIAPHTANLPRTPKENSMEPGTDLVCGPENVREFNAALRQAAPECLELIRALRAEGLLDGLRGARLMSLDVANARQAADAPRTVSGHQIITHTQGKQHGTRHRPRLRPRKRARRRPPRRATRRPPHVARRRKRPSSRRRPAHGQRTPDHHPHPVRGPIRGAGGAKKGPPMTTDAARTQTATPSPQ